MRVLICTDGSSTAEQSAALVCRLFLSTNAEVTLLGVSETDGDQVGLEASFERCEGLLGVAGGPVNRKIRYGDPAEQILNEVEEKPADLVGIGARVQPRTPGGGKLGATTHKP